MNTMDVYASRSPLRRTAPGFKILWAVIPLLICIGFGSFSVSFLTIAVMIYCTVLRGGTPWKTYLHFLRIPAGFICIGAIVILVVRRENMESLLIGVQIGTGYFGISRISLLQSMALICKAMAGVCCMYFLTFTTPMNGLLHTFRQIHCPVVLIELMELIYRFIFVLSGEAGRMHTAQSVRLGYIGFRRALHSTGGLAALLLLRALRRGDRVYTALEARCYTGILPYLRQEYTKIRAGAVWGLILFCCLLIGLGILEKQVLGNLFSI
ncbi:MAG TPA: cobalt ECF transporter T component CbiQ [Firmicutes bacterium]|nr:cobalt ECF transporter T component CbiQ [Bacillota bacterium]